MPLKWTKAVGEGLGGYFVVKVRDFWLRQDGGFFGRLDIST
jgi:hypothetical protein